MMDVFLAYCSYFSSVIPALLFGLLMLVISIVKFVRLLTSASPERISLLWVWLSGFISFLLSVLAVIIDIIRTFDDIATAGDISPTIVSEGIGMAMQSQVIGLGFFTLSMILWGLLQWLRSAKSSR